MTFQFIFPQFGKNNCFMHLNEVELLQKLLENNFFRYANIKLRRKLKSVFSGVASIDLIPTNAKL